MIPVTDIELDNIEFTQEPTKTYALDIETGRIRGTTTGTDAMKQAIYLMLNTERYKYLIHSWNYGIELEDLIGKSKSYVFPEVKRFISEALLQDDRITLVDDFIFTESGNKLTVEFTVHTSVGDIETEVTI